MLLGHMKILKYTGRVKKWDYQCFGQIFSKFSFVRMLDIEIKNVIKNNKNNFRTFKNKSGKPNFFEKNIFEIFLSHFFICMPKIRKKQNF